MDDHFQSLKERAIPGMAPWHKKTIKPDEVFDDEGVVYLGELENDLRFVVKCMKNDEIVERAKDLLDRLTT